MKKEDELKQTQSAKLKQEGEKEVQLYWSHGGETKGTPGYT